MQSQFKLGLETPDNGIVMWSYVVWLQTGFGLMIDNALYLLPWECVYQATAW
jgi:hypothetical protein